jgi:hypothetical protein
MTALWRCLFVVIAAGGCHFHTLAGEVKCPVALTETPGVVEPGSGWTVVAVAADRPLESVAIYLGPDNERAAQVPDVNRKKNLVESVTWNLLPHQHPYWVGCAYTATSALVFQKLGADLSRCTVSYDLLPSGRRLRVKTLVCH